MNHHTEADPSELLARIRAGSREAPGQLLELYRGYLTLLARLQISNRLQAKVDASDLVQETFCEAHRDFPQFRGRTGQDLTAWLRSILAHRISKLVRGYYGTQARDVQLEWRFGERRSSRRPALDDALIAAQTSPSHGAARREDSVRLAAALEQLPEHYREVLVLRHVHGLSFVDVAQRCHRSVDGVKHIWYRALAQLRQHLGEAP